MFYIYIVLINLFNLFIFGCVGSSLRLLFVVVRRLLIAVASLVAGHGL